MRTPKRDEHELSGVRSGRDLVLCVWPGCRVVVTDGVCPRYLKGPVLLLQLDRPRTVTRRQATPPACRYPTQNAQNVGIL